MKSWIFPDRFGPIDTFFLLRQNYCKFFVGLIGTISSVSRLVCKLHRLPSCDSKQTWIIHGRRHSLVGGIPSSWSAFIDKICIEAHSAMMSDCMEECYDWFPFSGMTVTYIHTPLLAVECINRGFFELNTERVY